MIRCAVCDTEREDDVPTCPNCPADAEDIPDEERRPRRRMTREDFQQGLADRGIDTWEEYRNER